jgi:hypothetical protein
MIAILVFLLFGLTAWIIGANLSGYGWQPFDTAMVSFTCCALFALLTVALMRGGSFADAIEADDEGEHDGMGVRPMSTLLVMAF